MNVIFELNKLCKPRLVSKFFNISAESSLIHQLYKLVRSGKSEEKIVEKLYGEGVTTEHPSYKALRTRLRSILLEAFMRQEMRNPSYKDYDEAYQHGFQQLSLLRVLVAKRAYRVARDIAVVTYKNVGPYEIVLLNLGLTDILTSLHLGVSYDKKRFERYAKLYDYYSQAALALNTVSGYYRKIKSAIYAQRESPMTTGKRAGQYLEACAHFREKYSHISQIQGMLINIEMTGCNLRGEYVEAIEASERGNKILLSCHGVSKSVLNIQAISRVECTIKLNDFELGRKQIEAAKSQITLNSMHELKLVEYAILLGFRTKNYEYAYREFAALDKQKIVHLLLARHAEIWVILEAAINLLIVAGEIEPKASWPELPEFETSDFINDVPAFRKEKGGLNIQILVIQALYFIVLGKYREMEKRTEALEYYCKRYLKNDENRRNDAFFKLLLVVIKAGFEQNKAEEKGRYTLSKLEASTDWSELNNTEIIPYEDLWAILLKHLTRKPSRKKKKKKPTKQ